MSAKYSGSAYYRKKYDRGSQQGVIDSTTSTCIMPMPIRNVSLVFGPRGPIPQTTTGPPVFPVVNGPGYIPGPRFSPWPPMHLNPTRSRMAPNGIPFLPGNGFMPPNGNAMYMHSNPNGNVRLSHNPNAFISSAAPGSMPSNGYPPPLQQYGQPTYQRSPPRYGQPPFQRSPPRYGHRYSTYRAYKYGYYNGGGVNQPPYVPNAGGMGVGEAYAGPGPQFGYVPAIPYMAPVPLQQPQPQQKQQRVSPPVQSNLNPNALPFVPGKNNNKN